MQISVKADIKAATRGLANLHKKQIPFAMSKAMNATLKDVVKDEQQESERAFDDVRPWTRRAFKEHRSNKRQWPHLVASISIWPSQWEYLQYQIKGGTRMPEMRAIPAPVNHRARRNAGTINNLLAKDNTFSGKPKGHSGAQPGIYRRPKRGHQRASKQRIGKRDAVRGITGRVGKKKGKVGTVGKQKGLVLLYGYRKSASYAKRHRYYQIVPQTVRRRFPTHANREMQNAIRTAK